MNINTSNYILAPDLKLTPALFSILTDWNTACYTTRPGTNTKWAIQRIIAKQGEKVAAFNLGTYG